MSSNGILHRGNTCPACAEKGFGPEAFSAGNRRYRSCHNCGFIAMVPEDHLDEEAQKQRYLLHRNTIEDEGYVAWLERFLAFALPQGTELDILDFGSGPNPVMAELMTRQGHHVAREDLFFAPGLRPGMFDLISVVEVLEHIARPLDTLKMLRNRLKDHGRICISTEFIPEGIESFREWHYRSDPTHISFFSLNSLEVLARRADLSVTGTDGQRYLSLELPCPGET